ncbi:MAG: ABC transporter substrate-binding protein, partial [Alphaproteobacteria bacterium]|nr:ABC transporter substrate-binding protein [Alphaproteobacteria bacterium]
MKRLIIAAALAAAAILPIEAAAQKKDNVVVGMRLEPPHLDPTANAAAAIAEVTHYNIYETLTRIDSLGRVGPGLAESWAISPDGKTYTFKLRSGVVFSDGAPLTSADVKFSYERAAADNSTNPRKRYYTQIASIATPDAATVAVTLKDPSSFFLFNMGEPSAIIVSDKSAATNQANPVGSGPFMLDTWRKGASISLKRNPRYRDPGAVALQRVDFRIIGDATAQVSAVLAGDVDYIPIIGAPETLQQFYKDARYRVLVGTTEGETLLTINNARKPFDDIRVRRALSHAIDRKAIIDGAMAGYGTPIGTHFAPHHPAYVDLVGRYPHDIAKAKALLKEAGVKEGHEISLKLPPPEYARRGGEIVAAQLRKIGLKVKIEPVEWAQWLDQVFKQTQYDLTIVSHVEPLDIGIYSQKPYYFNYNSPEFDDLFKKANTAITVEDQTRWLQAAQRKLTEDAVVVWMF